MDIGVDVGRRVVIGTLSVAALSAVTGVAMTAENTADGETPLVTGRAKATVMRTIFTQVVWSGVPFRHAIMRIAQQLNVGVLIDRRLDPDRTVELRVETPTDAARMFGIVAELQSATVIECGDILLLTPRTAAEKWTDMQRTWVLEQKRASATLRSALTRGGEVSWSDFARPRRLVERWCDAELAPVGRPESYDAIPHDHIAAARLPAVPLADRLLLIAFQYDVIPRITGPRLIFEGAGMKR